MKKNKLTNREYDIMEIFWKADKPLCSNDIHEIDPTISINTIQPTLKKLCNKGFINVSGIGFTKNVITRLYDVSISQSEYLSSFLEAEAKLKFASALIQNTKDLDVIEQFEKLIELKKKELIK